MINHAYVLHPEVALGWDFSGIPNPGIKIPGFWDFYPKKSQILKSQNPGIFWDRDRFFWDIPGFFKISKTLCKMLNYMLYFSDRFFFRW